MDHLTFNAWLTNKLSSYTFQMHDATVDFFIAENKLNLTPHCLSAIKDYDMTCMKLAEIAKDNGDEVSYLQAIRKNYYCMLSQIKGMTDDKERTHVCSYARLCLKMIYAHYILNDEQKKAQQFRSHFVVQMSK
jgi:hypothetical protein